MITRLLCVALWCLPATVLYGQKHEIEPNDTPGTATKIALADTAAGVLTKAGRLDNNPDWWRFEAVAGDTLRFEVASRHAWMRLYAEDGTTLLREEIRDEPRLWYTVTQPGTYFLQVSGIPVNGSVDEYYEIYLFTTRHPKPPCALASDGEPNDVPPSARVVALGERVEAILCPGSDVDYYRFHATKRMRVQIRIDRDTGSKPAYWGSPQLLLQRDSLDTHWKNDWTRGSVFEFWVPQDGDYIASVRTVGNVSTSYALTVQSVGSVPSGSGDPVRTRATGLGYPLAMAVASNGDVYISQQERSIVRVSPSGTVSTFLSDCGCNPISLAFEPSGNLLVASPRGVRRITPSGESTLFINSTDYWGDFQGIAVAPDSTIWVATTFDEIVHYGRDGQYLDSIPVGGANPADFFPLHALAFAPDGILYFAAGTGVYRLLAGQPDLFVRDTTEADLLEAMWPIAGFTFDAQGNLYVAHGYSGGISMYDRTGAEIGKPFAWVAGAPRAIAFGRNADGSPNSCLFVLANASFNALPTTAAGRLDELNPSAVSTPGCPLTPLDPPVITVDDAVAELLHPGRLTAQQLTALDQQGNRNGRYDVGDLRAFLIARGGSSDQRE